MNNVKHSVAAFYKFTALDELQLLQDVFYKFLSSHAIKGTILLASEGINGTVSGTSESIESLKQFLDSQNLLSITDFKTSISDKEPFPRLKVKIKNEIVSIGNDLANPSTAVGEYVDPVDWNALIEQDDVLLIDARNTYECSIGTFQNALQPNTTNFREFPGWVEELEKTNPDKGQKIAMFCTGGIRCEKASSLMKAKGFAEVYHLKGGILNYMKTVEQESSLWQGECFVFDDRVALNHDLEVGSYDMCHGCRMPITADDKLSAKYEKGISCPDCFDFKTPAQKKRYADRQKQIDLAKARNQKHLGSE